MQFWFKYSLDGARDRSSWILLKDRLESPLVKYSSIFTVFGFFILLGDFFSAYLKLKVDSGGMNHFFPRFGFETRNYFYFFGLAFLFLAKLISDLRMPRAIRFFKDAYSYAEIRSSQSAYLLHDWIEELRNGSLSCPIVSSEDRSSRDKLKKLLDKYSKNIEYYSDPSVESDFRDLFRGLCVLSYQRMSRSRPVARASVYLFLVFGFLILSASTLDVILAILERLLWR